MPTQYDEQYTRDDEQTVELFLMRHFPSSNVVVYEHGCINSYERAYNPIKITYPCGSVDLSKSKDNGLWKAVVDFVGEDNYDFHDEEDNSFSPKTIGTLKEVVNEITRISIMLLRDAARDMKDLRDYGVNTDVDGWRDDI